MTRAAQIAREKDRRQAIQFVRWMLQAVLLPIAFGMAYLSATFYPGPGEGDHRRVVLGVLRGTGCAFLVWSLIRVLFLVIARIAVPEDAPSDPSEGYGRPRPVRRADVHSP